MSAARAAAALALAVQVAVPALGDPADDVARGDSAWERRAEGERGGRPQPGPIQAAVRAYERALAASPGSLETRWKLLRALHFAGAFATREEDERRSLLARGLEVSEAGLDRLARQLGEGVRLDEMEAPAVASRLAGTAAAPSDVARLYFWSAILWGSWSRSEGLLEAVREGAANRLHRYTELAIVLEPDYDGGGALRLLGRLHAELPRVPFVSGWVDRSRALPLVERAYALAPANPGNRLLLALTLLDLAPGRRAEALALLEQVGELTPRPSMRIEDLTMQEQARSRLEELRGAG